MVMVTAGIMASMEKRQMLTATVISTERAEWTQTAGESMPAT